MLLVSLLTACQDYVLGGEKDSPAPAAPELTLLDTALDVAGVCAAEAQAARVQNDGDAELIVSSLSVDGAGWRLGGISVPTSVAPGEILAIPLSASPGRATLTIRSNDADEGLVDVALTATEGEGPSVFISAPGEDEVIDPTVDVTLLAYTSDAEDPPTALSAEWISELTGPITTTTPDAEGRIESAWPASDRANGPQVISVRVTDTCGNTGEQTLYFCQDGEVPIDTLAENAWHTEADAIVDQPAATATLGPATGSAFDAFNRYDADQLTATFSVRGAGAGFSLTALDSARAGSDWIGGGGCGLGFGDCGGVALPGWSLAFDTQAGDGNDCATSPSLGLAVDGAMTGMTPCVGLPPVDDGDWHDVSVTVLAPRLTVLLDGDAVLDTDVDGLTPASAWLGFTGEGDWEFREVVYTDFTCR